MGLPSVDEATGYLPPGDWAATLEEIEEVFGGGPRRGEIMRALVEVVGRLRLHGVQVIWIDGSFVGAKRRPSDVDLIFEVPEGEDMSTWGPVASTNHDRLKSLDRIDLWHMPSFQRKGRFARRQTIKQFMETDRDGVPKGHILVRE